MTAKDLISILSTMPPNAPVRHLWDGAARSSIEHVWLSRKGEVITSDCNEIAYSTGERPVDSPTSLENQRWKTPSRPQISS